MKRISSTLKVRLIIICMLIGTIPAVIVGVFSYFKASNTVQNKVDEANMRNLQQVKMSVEQLLLIADHVMLQFVESPIVKANFPLEMNGSEFQAFNNTETIINNLPTADIGSNNISLANFSKDWVITYNGVYKLDEYERKREFQEYLKMPGSSFWVDTLSLKGLNTPDIPININGVSLIKKSPLFLENPSIIAVMSISYSRLSELVSNNQSLGEVMVVGQNGCIIAHNNIEMCGKSVSELDYFKTVNNIENRIGNFTVPIKGVQYSVNFVKSDYNNWIYLSVTSLASVTKESKSIGWFTFFACLGVIVSINFVAFFISNRIYMPIRKLYNLVGGIPEFSGVQEKKDELVLIEDRVNYLLKNQVKLKKQIYNQIEQLKEFFILKLLLSDMDEDFIESRIKLYDYPDLPDYACVWVIRIDTLNGTKYKENDMDLMLFAVNNIVDELMEESIVLKPVVIDEYQVTIVYGESGQREQYRDEAYSKAQKIQKIIKQALDISISIGISKPLDNYSEINRGYIEGIEALKHQILLGYNSIIFMEDVQGNSTFKPIFPAELEEDLLSAVKLCDLNKALELLHRFIERIFETETSRHEYQISIIRLATDLIFLLKESGESYSILIREGQSIYEQLFYLKTAGEVELWFAKTLIEPIVARIGISGEKQFKKIAEEALKIIREEYDTDLTLEECASRMNYHPSYIRRILKKEVGITFSDYLAQYRMDVAKKWLNETDMKIFDIAEKLRYKNPENFIRSFKKVMGITPGQYRDLNKDN